MLRRLIRGYLALALLVLPATGLGAVFANVFTNLYVLGDSLSDQGNLFAATSLLAGPANALPAADHYFAGRFSNGPVYTDVMAQRLGLALGPSIAGGNNFAYGGARTTYNTVENTAGGPFPAGLFPWSLARETAAFRARNIHDPGALFVVFSGANDIADMALGRNPLGITSTLAGIQDAIDAFKGAGARTVIVPNLPDLGLTPLFARNPDPRVDPRVATQLSMLFNARLHDLLETVTGVNVIEFDTFAIFNQVVSDPGAFGFTNASVPCYSGYVAPNPLGVECATPDAFVFWDLVHPTRAVHALLGNAILTALPVPSTLPLALLALLALAGLNARSFPLQPRAAGHAA